MGWTQEEHLIYELFKALHDYLVGKGMIEPHENLE